MIKRLILGITGGIASGKSTVMEALSKAGIPTVSSDELAHDAIRKGTPVYKRIVQRFGRGLLRSSGQICRTDLGKIVFRDHRQRKWLEKQIHPVVVRGLKRFTREHSGVIALDIPLLFEAKLQSIVDKVVVVYCAPEQQIRRLMRRNRCSREQALCRLRAQMPLQEKLRRADIVIGNAESVSALKAQVRKKLLT